jgi:2-oxoisovalerate dehydrogenase E1 component
MNKPAPHLVTPMQFDRRTLSDVQLVELYQALLLPRLIEEKMLLLLRQNKISKWFSGIGQEAIAVGCASTLQENDYILPLHRNLGVFTARHMPLKRLFCQWQGKAAGYTQGRDRSFHFGSVEDRIIGMISHLGSMLGVADGLALASNLQSGKKNKHIAVVFSGDGGASEGDFHEAINVAAVWGLPVIFLVENNGYGLSTPSNEQFRCAQFIDKAIGYGIEGVKVDGNNILDVYHTIKTCSDKVRKTRQPILLEAMTFRMRGHEEASGVKYVPPELFTLWEQKDPVENYEHYLLTEKILNSEQVEQMRLHLQQEIQNAWDETEAEPNIVADLKQELGDVYAPATYEITTPSEKQTSKRFVDAISEALRQAMERDPKLVIMGQDVAEYGGVFKITEGFVKQFGKDRVRNTPLCESAILGAALGLAICDIPSVVEMQFADFVSCGFNQIVNNLAKTHYRFGAAVNVTIRMPTGAGVGAGPFHSQSNEAWFTHVPGLKVVYPSTPYDAKGLLTTALLDPNPVMYFEHKLLYRSIDGLVPEDYYNIALGEARVVHVGNKGTIVTYGAGVHWALPLAQEYNLELIDLRTLLPWDKEAVFGSLAKTNRCLILHEDTLIGGFGGEIAASIAEECFEFLDAPVLRVASLDTPVPFNRTLEKQFLAQTRLLEAVKQLLAY